MADFSTVRHDKCREATLPEGCVLGRSKTVVLQSVLNEIKEHGRSSMHKEVCGVLVGSLCWDGGPYLLIDGRIEGKYASHQSGSVTFTSETWDYIHEELTANHTDRIIVGWYHTHPGFGIFLSNMDAFIHENFFSFPWQPAYVFDPQAETDGFFFRVGTELVKEEVCVSADVAPIVKEPQINNIIQEKVIVEDVTKRRYVLRSIMATFIVCCLSVIMMLTIKHFQANSDTDKVAESHDGTPQDTLAETNSAIGCRQQETNGWNVQKETYEKEIGGLQIKVTTITAERTNIEKSYSEKQSEIDRLREECERLEKTVQERETLIDKKNREVARLKSCQTSDQGKVQRLRQRIKEFEASTMRLESEGMASPHDDGTTGNSNSTETARKVRITK